MISIIKDLYDIGKDLLGFADNIKQQDLDKRKAVAQVLTHIGNVLDDTYQKLNNGIYPGGNCQQLEVFSNELYVKLKDVTDEIKAKGIYDKLINSHKVEMLLSELNNNNMNKDELKLLADASGYFLASAQIMSIP